MGEFKITWSKLICKGSIVNLSVKFPMTYSRLISSKYRNLGFSALFLFTSPRIDLFDCIVLDLYINFVISPGLAKKENLL